MAYVLTVAVNRISEAFCNIYIRRSTALDIWNTGVESGHKELIHNVLAYVSSSYVVTNLKIFLSGSSINVVVNDQFCDAFDINEIEALFSILLLFSAVYYQSTNVYSHIFLYHKYMQTKPKCMARHTKI